MDWRSTGPGDAAAAGGRNRSAGRSSPPRRTPAASIASYLRLDVDLGQLYEEFSEADPWIAAAVSHFPGLRLLDQEPQETLLSYICSTANSVSRISRAVEAMSRLYGRFIANLDGQDYFEFPSADSLAGASEEKLSGECGLGWRGANLKRVAAELMGRPEGWPVQLRDRPYREAKAALMELRGVGAKIADCVCLFSLGKDEAVPVDTHIWAVAKEIFGLEVPTRTLTPATYETLARLFTDRYGPFAGWAQEYLYIQRRASKQLFKE